MLTLLCSVHSQYAVRWNLGRHMRCLSTLMIRLLFSSWKKVAASTDMHNKTAEQAPTRASAQLQPAPGLCSARWELSVTLATCSKWLKKSGFKKKKKEFSKGHKWGVGGEEHWLFLQCTCRTELNSLAPCEVKLSLRCFLNLKKTVLVVAFTSCCVPMRWGERGNY